ncbi:MAG: hypothetical protein AB1631_06210 [Acidobacteriota bacterium]
MNDPLIVYSYLKAGEGRNLIAHCKGEVDELPSVKSDLFQGDVVMSGRKREGRFFQKQIERGEADVEEI